MGLELGVGGGWGVREGRWGRGELLLLLLFWCVMRGRRVKKVRYIFQNFYGGGIN